MPMRHVAMKVLVANHLKKRNLAVVRHVWVGPKAADGPISASQHPPPSANY
jgi:hypothetical protein